MIRIGRRFDDRAVDFLSGRKVSPPMSERRVCDCCGQRIVKGFELADGGSIGEDCEDIIRRASSERQCGFAADVETFDARRKRSIGWTLKPVVRKYLAANVFA